MTLKSPRRRHPFRNRDGIVGAGFRVQGPGSDRHRRHRHRILHRPIAAGAGEIRQIKGRTAAGNGMAGRRRRKSHRAVRGGKGPHDSSSFPP